MLTFSFCDGCVGFNVDVFDELGRHIYDCMSLRSVDGPMFAQGQSTESRPKESVRAIASLGVLFSSRVLEVSSNTRSYADVFA